ncbi:MAG: hypothetical protein WC657_09555, partial [Candidatus Paceibacterota bacterium]
DARLGKRIRAVSSDFSMDWAICVSLAGVRAGLGGRRAGCVEGVQPAPADKKSGPLEMKDLGSFRSWQRRR